MGMSKEFGSAVVGFALLTGAAGCQVAERAVQRTIDNTTNRVTNSVTGAAQKKVDQGVQKVNKGVEDTVEKGLNTVTPEIK